MELNQLDLNKLYTFSAVAEHGGITPASKKLLLTRSAISQSVSGLEATLGTRLFNRVGKRMLLTEQGRALFDSFRRYQDDLKTTVEAITSRVPLQEKDVQGTVRLGLFVGFSKARLTDFLSEFAKLYPKTRLRMLFLSQAELVTLLTENKIDFALSIYPLASKSKTVRSTPLLREDLILVSGKKHWIRAPSLKDFCTLPIVDYFQSEPLFKAWVRHHFGCDLENEAELDVRAYGAAVDFVLELILKDVGVGVVPRYVAEPYLRAKRLFQMRTGKSELSGSIWLNEVSGLQYGAAADRFVAQMKRHFRKM